jgi:hypothetical protein
VGRGICLGKNWFKLQNCHIVVKLILDFRSSNQQIVGKSRLTVPISRTLTCPLDTSDYRTVSPYWVLPVYVELIVAVWADDGDRPLLF